MPRPSLDEYLSAEWPGLAMPTEQEYTINMRSVTAAFSQSSFMTGLDGILRRAADDYSPDPNLLFGGEPVPLQVFVKSFGSVQNKCYRQNCLENAAFPEPPDGGFIRELDMYRRVNDLLRSRIICRYMDGPEFLCERIAAYCDSLGLESKFAPKANDRGYYAWHTYVMFPSEVLYGEAKNIDISFEIQITTHLADVLSALTHGLYEGERIGEGAPAGEWRWKPKELRFQTAYMGHTLHMLEGIILELKDRVSEPDAAKGE